MNLYPRSGVRYKQASIELLTHQSKIARLEEHINHLENLVKKRLTPAEVLIQARDALELEREQYRREEIRLEFLAIFSGPIVNFDRMKQTEGSLEEVQRSVRWSEYEISLCFGEDPKLGFFVAGEFFEKDQSDKWHLKRFVADSGSYYEFFPDYGSLMYRFVSERRAINTEIREKFEVLSTLFRTGIAGKLGNDFKWPAFRQWKDLYGST